MLTSGGKIKCQDEEIVGKKAYDSVELVVIEMITLDEVHHHLSGRFVKTKKNGKFPKKNKNSYYFFL